MDTADRIDMSRADQRLLSEIHSEADDVAVLIADVKAALTMQLAAARAVKGDDFALKRMLTARPDEHVNKAVELFEEAFRHLAMAMTQPVALKAPS